MEGSFNKINNFIANQIIGLSSVKSRKIICKQTGQVEISSFNIILYCT